MYLGNRLARVYLSTPSVLISLPKVAGWVMFILSFSELGIGRWRAPGYRGGWGGWGVPCGTEDHLRQGVVGGDHDIIFTNVGCGGNANDGDPIYRTVSYTLPPTHDIRRHAPDRAGGRCSGVRACVRHWA
jgi:hypothetical protein